ncbi:uncharacterized protein LOC114912181 [Scleropages formosus]|uniref:uncharacterized protein LOC114912181 n=1 Tax=Scleropages formosus TaxID=113540 RepID=UPI0010FAB1E3|nr:uncharacterized protein LOC114912181 [Scleropages formosus]
MRSLSRQTGAAPHGPRFDSVIGIQRRSQRSQNFLRFSVSSAGPRLRTPRVDPPEGLSQASRCDLLPDFRPVSRPGSVHLGPGDDPPPRAQARRSAPGPIIIIIIIIMPGAAARAVAREREVTHATRRTQSGSHEEEAGTRHAASEVEEREGGSGERARAAGCWTETPLSPRSDSGTPRHLLLPPHGSLSDLAGMDDEDDDDEDEEDDARSSGCERKKKKNSASGCVESLASCPTFAGGCDPTRVSGAEVGQIRPRARVCACVCRDCDRRKPDSLLEEI